MSPFKTQQKPGKAFVRLPFPTCSLRTRGRSAVEARRRRAPGPAQSEGRWAHNCRSSGGEKPRIAPCWGLVCDEAEAPKFRDLSNLRRQAMDPPARKEKPKVKEPVSRVEKAKQKSAQQELKQRQRAEIYALNRVMTELEQQQFDEFCKQMQPPRE
ncbi:small vasohibin-binding protein isoform X2 [Nycticebus coucang]|uniref:small vasohibin-binding protein isoform X2 n=1 Tax=Nycticebus coucang TaxID=9470 RepID=UPI00234D67FD|nr:small vasohibin-binding protein isoform X2 [Nycticebus coucang]